MHLARLSGFFGGTLLLVTLALHSASGESITLSWDNNSEPDLAGYRVHYGTIAEPFNKLIDVKTTKATLANLLSGSTYIFAVTAYNAAGKESAYSSAVTYTLGLPKGVLPAALANVSTRTNVKTGEDVMIGGFIIEGTAAKKVVLRAIGPSLAAAAVDGALADPLLKLLNSNGTLIASNDRWNIAGQEVGALGLAPGDAREAALIATLPAGAYSAIVSGKRLASGVALFELYDLDPASSRIANISTRSRVESGDNVMIGGFILRDAKPTKVIVRAIGPSLGLSDVSDALPDPTLEMYDGNGTLLAANDNWRTDQEAAIVDSTVAPADNREAAIVSTLAPGAYSAVIRGANGATGVALFEVYALRP